MRKLTREEIADLKTRMVPMSEACPVRFMYNGRNFNPCTGELMPLGVNVIYQTVYWCFDRITAREIAAITGTRPQFDGARKVAKAA